MTSNIQISKKLNDGTILVIGGEDANSFAANVQEMVGSESAHILAAFSDLVPTAAGGAPWQEQSPGQAAAVVQQQVPDATPSGPSCRHGARVWKEGTSKAGKPYKMWKCPSTNRNDECGAEWVK